MSKAKLKSKPVSPNRKKSTKKKTYKKGSLKEAIYRLFDRKGTTKVSYKEVENLAKEKMLNQTVQTVTHVA